MNILDHIVAAISPERGLRRVRARGAIEVLRRGYDGAKTGRRTDGWITVGNDANAEIAMASTRLRNRARDLVRNNPFAAKSVITYASSMVGSGIRPRPKADSKALDEQVPSSAMSVKCAQPYGTAMAQASNEHPWSNAPIQVQHDQPIYFTVAAVLETGWTLQEEIRAQCAMP